MSRAVIPVYIVTRGPKDTHVTKRIYRLDYQREFGWAD